MSHTASIKGIKITNIDALRTAIEDLNEQGIQCSLQDNATPRAYFKDQAGMGKADHVVTITNCPYDLGLYKQPDGTYEVRTDFWAGAVERVFGVKASDPAKADQAKLGKLFQAYGLAAATIEATQRGYTVRRVEAENGTMQLIVNGF